MTKAARLRPAILAAAILATACGVESTDIPSLTGPSELALSVTVTATPDSISWDGYSQSAVVISAHGPDGAPKSGVVFRLDMATGSVPQDFGSLSLRTIVTGADGRASSTYTAPAQPPSTSGSFQVVTILATPVGSNFQTSVTHSAEIRLVRPGVVMPPADAPLANFTFSPAAPSNSTRVFFDASSSCATASGICSPAGIVSYAWSFGDGTQGSGVAPSKVYDVPGSYTVTLTVTNDRGRSHQATRQINIGSEALPVASFVFSPTAPAVSQAVQFDASLSLAQSGRVLVGYSWNWGDGTPSSTGVTTSHTFTTAGTYNVVLTVTDNVGQTGTTTRTVTVGTGAPIGSFTFAVINAGTHTIAVDGGASSGAGGATISTYAWSWGDGTSDAASANATASHSYAAAGTYSVRLTVTDSLGRTGVLTQSVVVP
jgi:PKD repeat protein